MEKKSKTIFLTKKDYISGYNRGKYDFVESTAQKNINECKNDTDVIIMEVKTGSGLQVLSAEKVNEKKFIELTSVTN